jgi:hypothetical protein
MLMVIITIGTDLKIFKTLDESEKPLTLVELAETTGASPRLLGINRALDLLWVELNIYQVICFVLKQLQVCSMSPAKIPLLQIASLVC